MKLYYYKGTKPNFGDDLNLSMWPQLLPNIWNDNSETIFLGIGSILFNSFPAESKKIVFGAGYGGYTPLPKIDEKWKVYFVRGKLTANLLGIDPALAIGDSAILLRSCIKQRPAKCHKVSFMPHWESTDDGAWEQVCKLASINYIDPKKPVDYVLDQILKSEVLITEAMHGAIAADALRVPWIAVTPIQKRHQMKWHDWASALDLKLHPQHLVPSTMVETAIEIGGAQEYIVSHIRANRGKINKIFPGYFLEKAAARLRVISQSPQSLSHDQIIETAHSKMLENIEILMADLKINK
ncbi:polysaccharide pyruvyl transferase family protein [Actimicrobium sp. CCC2.4]|uniref:polysaccharide pyruvyl transferase family protein n=1 Tax=Actimicrobium sp. CCC2.4 TaxID=3048606 RepID=UPI002AC9B04D|nr:polysaccharide pyruvyl transferase family protein [Actimicrobium sp. CCC2.4]MEB0136029.1 polysaccharide pyruvyl transferase family protein [Actimicrobium sp. CCC2.4]WPX32692.1 polysaccharide pyruvyl transferase family protein [Actimicrobium sp. CCC2.4]